jgi:cation transport ATPase
LHATAAAAAAAATTAYTAAATAATTAGKTSQALTLLMRLQPHKALLIEGYTDSTTIIATGTAAAAATAAAETANYTEREIDIHLVEPGDVLRVLPGAQVRIISGIF